MALRHGPRADRDRAPGPRPLRPARHGARRTAYHELPPFRWHDGPRPVLERAEQLPDGSVHLLRIRPVPRGRRARGDGAGRPRDRGAGAARRPRAPRARRSTSDLAGFHRVCAREPLLRSVARLGLGRLLRGTSVFEDVVKVLAASNTHVDRRAALGHAPHVASADAAPHGRRCGRSRRRRLLARIPVRRLAGTYAGSATAPRGSATLARDVVAGRRDLEALDRLPVARAPPATLRTVRGLGPVGVAWLLLLLGHHDEPVLDRADQGVRTAHPRWRRGSLSSAGCAARAPWRGLALWLAARVARPGRRRAPQDDPVAGSPCAPSRS